MVLIIHRHLQKSKEKYLFQKRQSSCTNSCDPVFLHFAFPSKYSKFVFYRTGKLEGHSFHNIYTSFYRKSFLYVKSYVHDDLVAEDIVSDSLIKIWEKVQHDNSVKVAPYLFTILKNKALDHLKHEKVKQQAISSMSDFIQRDMEIRLSTLDGSDPDYIFSSEVTKIIRETLEKLPPKTRQIFEMSRFEGKTHKEIATHFHISEKGIEYHLFQALSALRKSLKDYLPIWLWILYKI